MTQIYTEFSEPREMSDGEYIIARSQKQNFDDVRIETGWFDAEPGEKGKWETVVGAIIQNDLMGEMNLQEGKGSISRDKAVKNLTKRTSGGESFAENEEIAHALLDYFDAEEGAITIDDGDVILLSDPNALADEEADINGSAEYRILSWAAAIDACIDRMDGTLSEFEQAKERLQDRTSEVKNEPSEAERLMKERGQELRTLGSGSGIPDPADLDESDRGRYEQLKEDFVYYKKLHEVEQENLGAVEQGINQLVRNIDRLEAAKGTYEEKLDQVRRWALSKQVFPDDAIDLANNMADMITALSNTSSVSEEVDQMDSEDLKDAVSDALNSTDTMTEVANETVDDDLGDTTDDMVMDQD
ncbi:hypothetical protein [Haloarcula sp. H-GB5]